MREKKTHSQRKPRSFAVAGNDTKVKSAPAKTKNNKTRKPRAITKPVEMVMQPDNAVDNAYQDLDQLTPEPMAYHKKTTFGWGRLAIWAFSTLFAISIGLAIDGLIRNLFSRSDWLGWTAMGITALGVLALLVMLIKELFGIYRLSNLEKIRRSAESANHNNDLKAANVVIGKLLNLFQHRPDTAHGRALLKDHQNAIMSGRELLGLAERDLLSPLDKTARSLIMASAKRVSIVTAVSPRAIVDIGFVLFENVRLIRNIAELYAGKPSFFSSLRLMRQVITHLAATGAIAVGDGLLQQIIGHGLAARISARLGEGVVNGLLTARIGIAASDVCRPLKFETVKRSNISDFVSELANLRDKPTTGEK